MVATRRSLPNASDEHDEDDDDVQTPPVDDSVRGVEAEPDMENRRVRNALRKLRIDGTAALAGNRVNRRETAGTYHYRGAVYDITADTPQTWIDQQPMRYRQSESETRLTPRHQRVRKRRLADMEDGPSGEDHDDEARPAKRTRRSLARMSTRSRHPQSMAEASYHTRSTTATDKVANGRDRRLRERHHRNVTSTPARRSDLVAMIAAARDVARDKGYQVEPLEESDVSNTGRRITVSVCSAIVRLVQVNSRIIKLSKLYRDMKERGEIDHLLELGDRTSVTTADNTSHGAEGKSGDDREEGNEDDEKAGNEEKENGEEGGKQPGHGMPKPTDAASQAYGSPASASQQLQDREIPGTPSPRELSLSPGPPPNPTHDPSTRTTSAPTKQVAERSDSPIHKDTDVAQSIEREADAGPLDEDDGPAPATTTAPHAREPPSDEAVDRQIHDELANSVDFFPFKPPFAGLYPFAPPYPVSKSVNPPSSGEQSQSTSRPWTPKLSDRLHDEERAESAIHRHRKETETPQARRRRVQRELDLVRSWPLATKTPRPGSGGVGSGTAGVGGALAVAETDA